jgi:nucleotide-binding universal stress UspA family protein/CBS domain-containing protein
MRQIKDVMTHTVEVASPDDTLQQVSEKMRAHDIGVLPVWFGGQLMGIITDRDIAVRAVAHGHDPADSKVADFMTRNVITCYEDQTVEEAARLMAWKRIRRLVVLNRNERMVGMVALGDLAIDGGTEKLAGEVLQHVSARSVPEHHGYARVLVALDGSLLAEQVLPHVEDLALKCGSIVTLLRAVSPQEAHAAAASTRATSGISEGRAAAPAVAGVAENLRADAASYLEEIEHRLIARGITVERECPEGRPADAILQRARHLGVDLIAMTTHGRGALGRMFFGGVASAVLQTAPCPVLLVRVRQAEQGED